MKKAFLVAGALALVLSLAMIAGCGSKEAEAQTCAGCGMTMTEGHSQMIDGKAYCSHCAEKMNPAATETGNQVAMHDCDGGCGMKDVPANQLTEVNGKYYCQGCLKKMNTDQGGDSH